jgi:Cys-rich protein (TIGR04453 family)
MSRRLHGAAVALVAFGLASSIAGCDKSSCEKACARLARCKLESQQGERMLGERAMPPDPACMDRCARQTESFATCESTKRECAPLLECSRALGY